MKQIVCLCLVLAVLCLCAGCQTESQKTIFAMNTVMDLQLWGAQSETAMQQIEALLQELETRWSATSEDSLLGQMNRGQQVQLSQEDTALLERVQVLSRRTEGCFDPKLGSVSRAWGFYNEAWQVPTPEQIAAAMNDPQWDLGAAMKGYAGDRCVAILQKLDIDRGILNLGGNIQTYGEKPDGSPWTVGIQNPNGGDYVGTVSVTGTMAVVTSGDYQRYFEQGGIRYHHIIDPATGAPARSGLRSVTVICRDGLTADALSTALFVMGLEKAAAHWRQNSDFEMVLITAEGTIYATEGANLSGCEYEVICREN